MNQQFTRQLQNLNERVNASFAMLKEQKALLASKDQQIDQMMQNYKVLETRLKSGGGDVGQIPHLQYIEQIPGRRIPFTLTVRIDIGSNVSSTQSASVTISQDGPFVAVARRIAFVSAYKFKVQDAETGAIANFVGRSNGRYRPCSSVSDLNDAGAGVFNPVTGAALPGAGNAIYASPSNHSSFRTMSFDGDIRFVSQGSAYPRQNLAEPSAFFQNNINEEDELASLDFFERGETLNWEVTPTHVNNPPYGNVSSFGAGNFPFLDSQYDVHEGIVDAPGDNPPDTDPVTRLPDGVLIIGFKGYKIIQPPGSVSKAFV